MMAENRPILDVIEKQEELGKMEAILGNEQTIASLVDDILDHYENYRENLLTGKAMIVAYSRPVAMKIYKRILELASGVDGQGRCCYDQSTTRIPRNGRTSSETSITRMNWRLSSKTTTVRSRLPLSWICG